MVEPLRHRQTKGAETDMPGLPSPRHIPTHMGISASTVGFNYSWVGSLIICFGIQV
jgi:hypothetical protein